jgi:hemerythrin-like domain-containing protein
MQTNDTQVKNLVWWYGTFEFIIHDHHAIEENVMIPYFAELGATLPPKIGVDHVALLTSTTRIHLELDALAAAPKTERAPLLAALAAYTLEFTAHFKEHLREEEDTVIPANVNLFTEPAHAKEQLRRILKFIKLKDQPLLLRCVRESEVIRF